jgi:hypothetical protein
MSFKHLRKLLLTASCVAAITALGHGETYTTYTKIPPLPKITLANFAMSKETIQFNTANAAGEKTYWAGKISISNTGVITGAGMLEKYDINGTQVGQRQPVSIISENSKISAPTIPIAPINSALLDNGGDDYFNKEQRADYRANIIIKFSNGFVARGKITYEHSLSLHKRWEPSYVYDELGNMNFTQVFAGYEGYDDSEIYPNVSITGPNGHIGFLSDD